jgi:cation diffusion facilitator CzcD-associated flavoprotein CzcO
MSEQGDKRVVNELMWPLTVLGVALLGGLVALILTGHSADDLVRAIAALGATASTLLSAGAYLRSTQAANRSQQAVKQTNGDLDARMTQAVHQGITHALTVAQQQAAGDVAPAPAKRPKRHPADAPTEKTTPPAA